jgi:hypothetical protein
LAADYPPQFYQGAFLQTEQRDYAGASKLFAEVAENDDASAEARTEARRRLAECREEIAASDLSSLMPEETLLYVQLANIGPQATRVLESLGLANNGGAGRGERIPIEDGLSFPLDFALSPALVREVGKLGGGAAAITGFDERGVPSGVAVIHLGGSDLIRGLVETGLQVVTPNDAIGEHATYRIPVDGETLWLVKTERLLIFSNNRDQVAAAAGRLTAGGEGSLQQSKSFAAATADRAESLLYVWADSQRAAPIVNQILQQEMQPQELIAARAVLNLEQIECATLSFGATEGGLRGRASVKFKPGHNHLLYGLVRTAPIGEDALRYIPASAGAVAAFGLNPPSGDGQSTSAAVQALALMDIGRELFANIRSVSIFVAPGESPLPEVGVVVLAQNAEKSKQLWGQLMSLPTKFGLLPPEAVRELEIQGQTVTQYSYPDAPPIFVTKPSGEALIIGTAGAVEASLAAAAGGQSLADQQGADGSLVKTGPYTSKAVFVRAAELLKSCERMMGEGERRAAHAAAPVIDDLEVALTVDEDPNELRVSLELAGVPRVSDMLRVAVAEYREHEAPRARRVSQPGAVSVGPPASAPAPPTAPAVELQSPAAVQ